MPICSGCHKELSGQQLLSPRLGGYVDNVISCVEYNGIIMKCLHLFKYKKCRDMMSEFLWIIERFIALYPSILDGVDLLVPVPISRERFRSRGYNQSAILAYGLSRTLGKPLLTDILRKTVNTSSQMGLSREKRVKNLRGSFTVTSSEQIYGRTVLLTDDVITTGATIETCSKELLAKGAKQVIGFTLARVLRDLSSRKMLPLYAIVPLLQLQLFS
ncbi:MAG: ComF family protein [Candidatus Omnitrophica bacterium]|nr:ComF family protein [Candidatus Omnitrophota bacterium]